jgi:TM2 domain-containing membrane protein YozV
MEPQTTSPEPVVAPVVQPTVQPIVQPVVEATPEIKTKKIPRQRHFLILFFFSFMWGTFGVDRMYMGLYGTGILKLLTFGGLGLWTMSDFIIVMTGTFKDKQGRVALQAEEYKKFASRTVFWFTIILAVTILASGAELIFSISQIASGGLNLNSIPGASQLTGGSDASQINSLLKQ